MAESDNLHNFSLPGAMSPSKCRERARENMRLADDAADHREKARHLQEAGDWLKRAEDMSARDDEPQ